MEGPAGDRWKATRGQAGGGGSCWGQVESYPGSGWKEEGPGQPVVPATPAAGEPGQTAPAYLPAGPSQAARGPSGLVLHLPPYVAASPPRSWGPYQLWGGHARQGGRAGRGPARGRSRPSLPGSFLRTVTCVGLSHAS